MLHALLADLTLLVHALFILFAAAGALLLPRWPRLAWAHLPAVLWGAWIEFSGAACPLTPLENRWRTLAGETPYAGDFIGHYLLAFVYPAGLTPAGQQWLGGLLLLVNGLLYGRLLSRWRRRGGQ